MFWRQSAQEKTGRGIEFDQRLLEAGWRASEDISNQLGATKTLARVAGMTRVPIKREE